MKLEKNFAIVLLGHGSRVSGAGKHMRRVAARLTKKHAFSQVATCFLSRLGPHFPEVFDDLVQQGVNRVLVIPYFLHGGMHILLDIPEMLQRQARRHPYVSLVLGENLGFDDLLVDLVHKRIQESSGHKDVRHIPLPARDAFPVPPGQCEFVPMKPEEAQRYLHENDADHHH
jgi:sirohydrochlorin ferrochelatase